MVDKMFRAYLTNRLTNESTFIYYKTWETPSIPCGFEVVEKDQEYIEDYDIDGNKLEFYEGDIVEFWKKNPTNAEKKVMVVEMPLLNYMLDDSWAFKVIGNQFENWDLLKTAM